MNISHLASYQICYGTAYKNHPDFKIENLVLLIFRTKLGSIFVRQLTNHRATPVRLFQMSQSTVPALLRHLLSKIIPNDSRVDVHSTTYLS